MTLNNISITPVSINDIKELRAISAKTFYDSFAWYNTPANMQHYLDNTLSEENLTEELKNPDSAFYFATSNGINIGYFKINFRNAQNEAMGDNAIELERIYVLAAYQGMKIGQLLLDKVIDITKQHNCQWLWLGVWEKNTGAIKFYERNGFEKFGTHPFMLGDDKQADILMKRRIG